MINIPEEQVMSTWRGDPSNPRVTIICTLYNHRNYIEETFRGFLMQNTAFPFEIIAHDDASTDGTADAVRDYSNRYPHIIIPILQKENRYGKDHWGHPESINPLIRGKYVALCEGDDYWTDSNKLEKQIRYMENHPDCAMTFHAVNYVRNGKVVQNDRRSETERDFSVEEIIKGSGDFCATSSLCCRTDAYVQYPRFRLMADIADYPQQILMAMLGKVHYFPEIMGVYRYMAEGSWTKIITSPEGVGKLFELIVNQIRWMSEFNCFTDYKYDDLINEQIEKVSYSGTYAKEQEIKRMNEIYRSASWKVGNALIQPIHALKVLMKRLHKS